jgi:hypothetical protein
LTSIAIGVRSWRMVTALIYRIDTYRQEIYRFDIATLPRSGRPCGPGAGAAAGVIAAECFSSMSS